MHRFLVCCWNKLLLKMKKVFFTKFVLVLHCLIRFFKLLLISCVLWSHSRLLAINVVSGLKPKPKNCNKNKPYKVYWSGNNGLYDNVQKTKSCTCEVRQVIVVWRQRVCHQDTQGEDSTCQAPDPPCGTLQAVNSNPGICREKGEKTFYIFFIYFMVFPQIKPVDAQWQNLLRS